MKYDNLTMPLGVNEISILLNVKPDTVSSWQLRGIFPKPDAYINDKKTRVWKLQTVFDWARATGRNRRKFVNYSDAGQFVSSYSSEASWPAATPNPTNIDSNDNLINNIGSYDDSNLN